MSIANGPIKWTVKAKKGVRKLVKIEDKNGELVFTIEKPDVINNKSGFIQVTPEAMYALEQIKAKTGLPTTKIATELILFAKDHYSVKVEI